jgi:hypothetical protein
MSPAMVRLSIRQTFGIGDGRTMSVAADIARESPVRINSTISVGVSTARPVMTGLPSGTASGRSYA